MPITVRIQDERGMPLDEDWDHANSSHALVAPDAAGVCLPFIDPYGDTVFNQLQLSHLLTELRAHRDSHANAALRSVLDGLLIYLAGAEDRVHVYVRFIGD